MHDNLGPRGEWHQPNYNLHKTCKNSTWLRATQNVLILPNFLNAVGRELNAALPTTTMMLRECIQLVFQLRPSTSGLRPRGGGVQGIQVVM